LLCQIQSNTSNVHDGLLLLGDWLINTSSLAPRCRISGRSPFHWALAHRMEHRDLLVGQGPPYESGYFYLELEAGAWSKLPASKGGGYDHVQRGGKRPGGRPS